MMPLFSHLKGNKYIWLAVIFLMFASFLSVYSSTSVLAYQKMGGNTTYFMLKHLFMLILGFGVIYVVHRVPPRFISGLAFPMLIIGIVGLVAVFLVGNRVNDSSRWIQIGGLSIQPSEFAKIALVVFVANRLGLKQNVDEPRKAFLPIIVAMGIVCGLIMIENLSTCLLVGFTCYMLMFIGRIPIKYMMGITLFVISMFVLIYVFAPYLPLPRAQTWRNRIDRHLNIGDEKETQVASDNNYQAEQALMAVSTGGFLGRGPGNSYMKNFLPMAFSDFIFSIILEEYGLIGGALILFCYWLIMMQSITVVRRCDRSFQMYLVLGLSLLIVFQAAINVAVSVGLIPVTGQTLPMVSMGGTSNVFIGMALGAILSVSREADERLAKAEPDSGNDAEPQPSPTNAKAEQTTAENEKTEVYEDAFMNLDI